MHCYKIYIYKQYCRKISVNFFQIGMPDNSESTIDPGAPEDKGSDYVDLRVMTLNCWGLYGVSSLRNERMNAIAKYLAESDYDIVLLQVKLKSLHY